MAASWPPDCPSGATEARRLPELAKRLGCDTSPRSPLLARHDAATSPVPGTYLQSEWAKRQLPGLYCVRLASIFLAGAAWGNIDRLKGVS